MSSIDRRAHVLDAALLVFARYGYRKASMDDVAKAAGISRPGLYFYFASKQELFRAAVEHALEDSVTAAQLALADPVRPLRERLIEAFDHWSGRFVGPMAAEIGTLIDSNPELLGTMPVEYPKRFLAIVTHALAAADDDHPSRTRIPPSAVARTLISTATGIKHEVGTRDEFRARMTTAIDLYRTR
ncbi:TetR/AcrR family transcriptional regulator [Goodfellowiella coeruleoviolacea]|uniref:Transcriptional regulator, TetR family n=1 Tax=Goodfellowiella coeruleoviolacea TaxID=334858 RepID=A0AAE3GKI0_9PSEU|nr:TetR/AcrR family transcriptional regulator [Goodfellowiella coeruleoviolacea]MCP2168909.1 transcriptional regulator, TetR family [Goodfellowiella coeruleoviolacea]